MPDKRVLVTMLVSENDFIRTWQFARTHALAAVCKNETEIDESLPPNWKISRAARAKRAMHLPPSPI